MTKREIEILIGKPETRELKKENFENLSSDEFFKELRRDLNFTQAEMVELFKIIFKDSFNTFSKGFITTLETKGKLKKKGEYYQKKVFDFLFNDVVYIDTDAVFVRR